MPRRPISIGDIQDEIVPDLLTGLPNRFAFQEELRRIDTGENLPLTILLCDVNKLKLINDSMGCATGDKLLKTFSTILDKACRQEDVLSRIAEDEFAFLLPRIDETSAREMIEQLKDKVFHDPSNFLKMSLSFGFKTKHHSEENIQDIFYEADQEMIREKAELKAGFLDKTILLILTTLFERNRYEREHSKSVGAICEKMGKNLGLKPAEVHNLKIAGIMHDIGKIAIDDAILHKKGKLTRSEWAQIKNHAQAGFQILNSTPGYAKIADTVRQHHEKWDGTGYPRRLKGEAILVSARIIAVAEAYDALTSKRIYRNPLTKEEAFEEIKRCSGTQFDPKIVQVFIDHYSEE